MNDDLDNVEYSEARQLLEMQNQLREDETFTQRCFSKVVRAPGLRADEEVYSKAYKDFGDWRAVAEYRNKELWIKYAAMQLDTTKEAAIKRADALVADLLPRLVNAGIR